MEKIFYAERSAYPTSEHAIKRVLTEYFALPNAKIIRNENGKPYLENGKSLFFSITHTAERLFIAVSDENVGIDAENLSRSVDFLPIVKKFSSAEREEIHSESDFLYHWTAKECAVKWLGGSIARDLLKLRFIKGKLSYGEIELPANLVFLQRDGILLAVCGERDFSNAEFIGI